MKDDLEQKLKEEYAHIDERLNCSDDLLKMMIFKSFGDRIATLYSMIEDKDLFSRILDTFGGMSLEFPTSEEFKSTITLLLVYYYKKVLGYSWKEIQKLIPYERDISLRYGAKIKSVDKTIQKLLNDFPKDSNK